MEKNSFCLFFQKNSLIYLWNGPYVYIHIYIYIYVCVCECVCVCVQLSVLLETCFTTAFSIIYFQGKKHIHRMWLYFLCIASDVGTTHSSVVIFLNFFKTSLSTSGSFIDNNNCNTTLTSLLLHCTIH